MQNLLFAALLAGVATGASAVTVYSEDFNSAGFVGSNLDPNGTSDCFSPTSYFFINNANGWSFNGCNTFLARPIYGQDGVLLLNGRNGAASRLITGLTIGQEYSLSFTMGGINGTLLSYLFTAPITQHLLNFDENLVTQASAIIDNITFVTVGGGAVPEPSSWAMLLAGFGMAGFAARRRAIAA